jgi:pimeloyl-ACP methyl ester carboxylesterase
MLTSSLGVRVICIERAGYGLSDFQPNRRLLDWPVYVGELADSLGIARFNALGFSAGGPYTLACAHLIPERLVQVGIADSAPPMVLREIYQVAPKILRINYELTRHAPSIPEIYFRLFWRFSRPNPDAILKMAVQHSSQADNDALSQPGLSSVLQEVWKENIHIESRGYTYDTEILKRDWDFRLKDIQKDIHLWQGEADANIPTAWARYLAKELPHCQATFFPDQGHFALFQHWEEILQTLR